MSLQSAEQAVTALAYEHEPPTPHAPSPSLPDTRRKQIR
jgi:hypothetical protein